MCPPVQDRNSCYRPAYGLIHESVNGLSSLFFGCIDHDKSELLFDEVIYCKESNKVDEPFTTPIKVDKESSYNPKNKRGNEIELFMCMKFTGVKIASIERPIDMSYIKNDDKEEKPKWIILDSKILRKKPVHNDRKNPHKD